MVAAACDRVIRWNGIDGAPEGQGISGAHLWVNRVVSVYLLTFMALHSTPQKVLKRYFGFSSFRPHQEEIVTAILDGRDLFAALPTGGGKSLCYQLPALLLPGLTVVISPLIALMEDQVAAAQQQGIAAARLNSSIPAEEARAVYRQLHAGEVRLLYVSPERLAIPAFREQLKEWGVSLFAVDEAHCISEWGHEFRREYRNLTSLKREFPTATVAAFTATATPSVQKDVISALNLKDPVVLRGSFDRPEIFYRVRRKNRVLHQIAEFARSRTGQSGIVYRSTRKGVEETARFLSEAGISSLPYHAGLSDTVRREHQHRFIRDEVDVIVATIAFGMGIDKSNVRWVVHGDLPRSVESYYQETGRAGRDGEDADTCLFFGPGDARTIRYHIDRTESEHEREQAERNLSAILRFTDSRVCRRTFLLRHFGEDHGGSCGRCDVCVEGMAETDRTVDAQKALSAILRTGERFGAHYIADVVTGVATDRIEEFRHHQLPTFGVGKDRSRSDWIALLHDLETAGYLQRRDGPRSGLVITHSGRMVLRGKETFSVSATSAHLEQPVPTAVWRDDQEALFQCLRGLRRRIARDAGVPPYVVFSDRTLKSVVRNRPETIQALLRVHGIGEVKAERFGDLLVEAIRNFNLSGECDDLEGKL
jgi:ATP-dependent DNA helicase RecQ